MADRPPRLVLLNGPPGIGKSTLARRYARVRPLALCLDVDELRGRIGGWEERPEESGLLARAAAVAAARAHLASGHDVVVPQYVARLEFVAELRQAATDAGAAFHHVCLTDERDAAVERFYARRADPAAAAHQAAAERQTGGPDAVRTMYDRLTTTLAGRGDVLHVATTAGAEDAAHAALLQALGDDAEVLAGGVANHGHVVRIGDEVIRPAKPWSRGVHAFLRALRDAGFDGASVPVDIHDGRERLRYVPGDVPLPPYPDWVQTDEAIAGLARLMRRMHDAAATFDPTGHEWNAEIADPRGGRVVCHNDVCLDNVVFRDGEPVALLDFDFAAPGRPVLDLARMARMCVPVDCEENNAILGFHPADRAHRLRVAADAYGLDATGRAELLGALDEIVAVSGNWVRARVEAGDRSFVDMVARIGGLERYDRLRAWWATDRPRVERALR